MEITLSHGFNYLVFLVVILCLLIGSTGFSHAQHVSLKPEKEVSFPANLSAPMVDFNLQSVGKKKFKVVLEKKSAANTKVRIYDILGNLIIEDKIKPEDGTEKSFDFSHINSELFVVEVGNLKFNRTKSIYAQSPGTPKKQSGEN